VIGERAAAAVAAVIADAGFAVERVTNDYGEDLMVQTSHAGQIDASRLWFQVKGTESLHRHRRKDGSLRYAVPAGHALKWIRSADPVVLVLWDVANGIGYWSWPANQTSDWQLSGSGATTVNLSFDAHAILDVRAVGTLAWAARLEHYRRLLLHAADVDEELNDIAGVQGTSWQDQRPFTTALMTDFLSLLGLIEWHPTDREALRLRQGVRAEFNRTAALHVADVEDPPEAVIPAGLELLDKRLRMLNPDVGMSRTLQTMALTALLSLLGAVPTESNDDPLGLRSLA
jgi:hypothetical protein